MQLVRTLGRVPDFLCDNSPQKWGHEYFGIPCLSPTELAAQDSATPIIICIRNHEQIQAQLAAMGFSELHAACFERGYHRLADIRPLRDDTVAQAQTTVSAELLPLTGRWALVTGATRGIGRQIALALASAGANVIIHGRRLEQAETVAQACAANGVQSRAVAADLGVFAELEGLLSWLDHDAPPIDILYNNAAISPSDYGGFWAMPPEAFQTSYAVNLVAPVRLCQQLIPPMKQRGFGRIVNVSSSIQKRPGEIAYACSKAALDKFAFDLQPELEGTGVMMSQLDPGWLRTNMGGEVAPHDVESVLPGALLGAMLDADMNGSWFSAQDYAEMTLHEAATKAFLIGACMPLKSSGLEI